MKASEKPQHRKVRAFRKIAFTLSSTRTLAFFVHSGEASHGALGMIRQDDVVIAVSNSG